MTTLPNPATSRAWRVVVLALAVLVGTVVVGANGQGPLGDLLDHRLTLTAFAASASPSANGNGNNGNGNGNVPFAISGTAAGLAPGVAQPLDLTIYNPQNFTIIVQTVTVKVASAGQGCSSTNVKANSFTGALAVPKHETRQITRSIRMVADPPNSCQLKTFPLTYTGTAVKK